MVVLFDLRSSQAVRAANASEAAHRRAVLEKRGYEVIGARISKRTGRHTLIYRGETRIPSTPTRHGVE